MSLNVDNLEITYKQLYEISLQIGQLIERELYTELTSLVEKKEHLLHETESLLKKILDAGEDAGHLSELCKKIEQQETLNMAELEKVRAEIKAELNKTSADKKLTDAYAMEKETNSTILDFRE